MTMTKRAFTNFIFASGARDFLSAGDCGRRFMIWPRAFESGKPGWKMDGDKLALDGNGNPIYINANGEEASVKGDTIANLNAEAKTHRTAKETAETALAKYRTADGKLLDPETAVKAVDMVGKLDAKKLIDSGEVDKLTDQIKSQFTTQLSEKDSALSEAQKTISAMRIDGVFKGSEFIADRVDIPRDMFEASMRGHFRDEDGKIVAYDRSGNKIMSDKTLGELASPDEALEKLVAAHPNKDRILKAQQNGGSGNGGGGGSRGQGKIVTRDQFAAMDAGQQAATAAAAAKGDMQIVD